MSAREKVVLICAVYPYGTYEDPFVVADLEALAREFDVTVVSMAKEDDLKRQPSEVALPEGTKLVHVKGRPKAIMLLVELSMFATRIGWQELAQLVRDGITPARLMDTLFSYGYAQNIKRGLAKAGLLDADQISDTVFFSFWMNNGALALTLAKRRHPELKYVCRALGVDLYNERNPHGRQPFQRLKRDAANHILFQSKLVQDAFEAQFGPEARAGQYVVNPLGVRPVERFDPALEEDAVSGRRVVSCSNVIPLKRVDLIASALARVKDKVDLTWVHFGDGPELERIKAMAEEAGIQARFYGRVPNEEVLGYYHTHKVDVFVTTTSSEGGNPVSVQEALSAGVPVIGTDVGGIPDSIHDNGVLLPTNPTVDEVADALERVLGAPDAELDAMRARSRKLWEDHFQQSKNKQLLIELLWRLLRHA